jgi:hypothetical protein
MPTMTDGFESIFRSQTESLLGLWRFAAVVGSVSLEGLALLYGSRRPREQALARMSQTMDDYMRSAAFIGLMRQGLKAMNRPSWLGASNRLLSFPSGFFERVFFERGFFEGGFFR